MAQSLLAAVAKEILTKLISLAGEEIKVVWGFKGELKRLVRRFKTAQALLCDAESRQIVQMETVQDWLQKLKAVACDADDMLDELAFEVLRQKLEVQNRMRNKDKGCGIEELGCLSNLKGALKIYGLEHVKSKEDAQKAKLLSNQNIQELRLHWSRGREENININEDEELLEGLKPFSNLKGLVIENFGGEKLVSWMMVTDYSSSLYNLVKMELKYCRRLEQIPELGHIPSLKVLRIEGMPNVTRIGSEFYGNDNFDGGSPQILTASLVFNT